MISSITKAFPTVADLNPPSADLINCQDIPPNFTAPGNTAQYTKGATLISLAALSGPGVSQKWKILSVTITGYLVIMMGTNSPLAMFGRLGKIIAGFDPFHQLVSTAVPSASQHTPWTNPIKPIPSDGVFTSTLWDPDADPFPPIKNQNWGVSVPIAGVQETLPIQTTISPPNPIPLLSGLQPGIGIWMKPSILGIQSGLVAGGDSGGLTIAMAQYTIDYDDGT